MLRKMYIITAFQNPISNIRKCAEISPILPLSMTKILSLLLKKLIPNPRAKPASPLLGLCSNSTHCLTQHDRIKVPVRALIFWDFTYLVVGD